MVRQEAGASMSPGSAQRMRIAIWAAVVVVVLAVLYPLGFNPFR